MGIYDDQYNRLLHQCVRSSLSDPHLWGPCVVLIENVFRWCHLLTPGTYGVTKYIRLLELTVVINSSDSMLFN